MRQGRREGKIEAGKEGLRQGRREGKTEAGKEGLRQEGRSESGMKGG